MAEEYVHERYEEKKRMNASTASSKASEQVLTADQQWAQDMEQWIAGNHSITSAELNRLQTLKSQYGRIEGLRKWQEERVAAGSHH